MTIRRSVSRHTRGQCGHGRGGASRGACSGSPRARATRRGRRRAELRTPGRVSSRVIKEQLTPPPETCQLTAMYFCADQSPPSRASLSTYTAGGHQVGVPSTAADLSILVVDLRARSESMPVFALRGLARVSASSPSIAANVDVVDSTRSEGGYSRYGPVRPETL